MNKRAFIATVVITLILILLLVEMKPVKVTEANPLPYYFTPNEDVPVLIVETPQNFTTYSVGSFLLNFTVIRPSSWYTTTRTLFQMPALGTISNVTVSLDGNEKYFDEFPKDFVNGSNGWCENYSIQIGPLGFGLNTLQIDVTAYTYYVSRDYYGKAGEPIYQYPMSVTDTIYLDLSGASSSSTPSPTQVYIVSPANGTLFETGDIPLAFTVIKPSSWKPNVAISDIQYKLDPVFNGDFATETSGWTDVPPTPSSERTQQYSLTVKNASDGNHCLMVRVTAEYPGGYLTNGVYAFFSVVRAEPSHQQLEQSPSSSESPTQQLTTELVQTPNPTSIIDYTYWLLSPALWAMAIALVVVGLMVYLVKQRVGK